MTEVTEQQFLINKVAIIYSPNNMDSVLATAILTNVLNVALVNEIKTFPYQRSSSNNSLPENYQEIYIVGADISPSDLPLLLELNSKQCKVCFYAYKTSTIYDNKTLSLMKSLDIKYDRFEITSFEDKHLQDDFISRKILTENFVPGTQTLLAKSFVKVLQKYLTFQSMTDDEIVFLFANIKMVSSSARGECEFLIKRIGEHFLDVGKDQVNTEWLRVWNEYLDYDREMRRLINTNNRMCYYAGQNGSAFYTPTVCVTERDSIHITRFIKYVHNDVISFEDTKECRVYRILSEKNISWYIKRFQPYDVWTEGSMIYLKTELPRHVS